MTDTPENPEEPRQHPEVGEEQEVLPASADSRRRIFELVEQISGSGQIVEHRFAEETSAEGVQFTWIASEVIKGAEEEDDDTLDELEKAADYSVDERRDDELVTYWTWKDGRSQKEVTLADGEKSGAVAVSRDDVTKLIEASGSDAILAEPSAGVWASEADILALEQAIEQRLMGSRKQRESSRRIETELDAEASFEARVQISPSGEVEDWQAEVSEFRRGGQELELRKWKVTPQTAEHFVHHPRVGGPANLVRAEEEERELGLPSMSEKEAGRFIRWLEAM